MSRRKPKVGSAEWWAKLPPSSKEKIRQTLRAKTIDKIIEYALTQGRMTAVLRNVLPMLDDAHLQYLHEELEALSAPAATLGGQP